MRPYTHTSVREPEHDFYRSLIEHSLQGLLIVQDQCIVFANPMMSTFSGYTIEELLAFSPTDLMNHIYPDDRERVAENLRRRLSGKPAPPRYVFRILRRDGVLRWIEVSASQTLYEEKPASLVVLVDITERKQAEEQLRHSHNELDRRVQERTTDLLCMNEMLQAEIAERELVEQQLRISEQKYRMLFENERDAISLVDTCSGQFLDVNPAWVLLYGYTSEEALSMQAEDVSQEPDATRGAYSIKRDEHGGVFIPVRWHRSKQGNVFAVELSMSIFTWNGREVTCVIARDITERIQMEQRVAEKGALLEAALENMDQGILMVDEAWNVVAYNQRLLSLFHYPENFFRTYPDFDSVLRYWARQGEHDTAMLEQALWEARRTDMFSFEVPLPGERIIEIHHSPFPGGGLVRTFADITERKRNEAALQQANEQLARSVQELERRNRDMRLLNHRLQDELNLARRIQQSLLPPTCPNWVELDVMCYTEPAHEVGGDLYVYHAFSLPCQTEVSGKYAIAVGDVSGKGMPAALLMAVSLASFHSIVGQGLAPGHVLAYLDDALVHYTQTTHQNCALVYLEITDMLSDPSFSGCRRVRVANAGCVTPILKRSNGQVSWIEAGGMPLGVGIGSTFGYEEVSLDVSAGDQIILLSDGVVEAKNATGEMFSFDRLECAVRAGPCTSAYAMLHHLRTEVAQFVGDTELHDDVTLVVIHV